MGSRRCRRYARVALACVAVGCVALACGDDGRDAAPRPRIPRARRVPPRDGPVRGESRDGAGLASPRFAVPYVEGPRPARAGSIVGRVTLRGPAVDPVYDAWPAMGTDAPTPAGRVVVGEGDALADVVVALVGIGAGKAFPRVPLGDVPRLRLVAEAGRVRPFVSVTRVGTQLELENRLPADWVVHGYEGGAGGPTRFNVSIGPGATWPDVAELFLEAPGVTFVAEDGRGAFQAYVVTSPHPYVDVTSAVARGDVGPGAFRFDDVPPGTYDVVAWHPGLAMRTSRGGGAPRYVAAPPVESVAHVTVGPSAVVEVAFEFEAPGTEPSRGR